MITVHVKIKASCRNALKTAIDLAFLWQSASRITGSTAIVTYICETTDRDKAIADVMDSVNIEEIENLGVELVGIT